MRRAWQLALALSAAACGPDDQTSACKDSLVSGDLVITEVFADFAPPDGGTGTDDGKEWFEIYNNADRPISLKGVSVVHSRPDGSKSALHSIDDVTLAPGQFFTLGNAAPDLVPAYVDYGFGGDLGDFFNTDGGMLALKCGSNNIDEAIYDTVKSGHSRQLTSQSPPDYTLNDDQNNWCEAKDTEFEVNNFGTPGEDNDCAPIIAGACSDGGTMRPAIAPAAGQLVITEVMPNPAAVSDTDGEWFEVIAKASVDLNGVELDRAGDTAGTTMISSPMCVHLDEGEYAVFTKNTAASGLPAGVIKGEFSFSMVDGSTAMPADVRILAGGTVIDSITWTSTRSGRTHALDPDSYDAAANDDPTVFCDGTAIYNTVAANSDYGTPGAVNAQCTAQPQPGQCLDNGTPRNIMKPAAGALVINEVLPDAAATGNDPTQEWFEIINTSGTAFDVNGLLMQGGGATTYPIMAPTCKTATANGGILLFAHSADTAVNGGLAGVDVAFTTSFSLSTTLKILDGTTLLDQVILSGVMDGKSKQLKLGSQSTTGNDTIGNFCDGQAGQNYGTVAANLGTPDMPNVCP